MTTFQTQSIPSTNPDYQLHVATWSPDQAPRACIQIMTGMTDYIERYRDFAHFLAANGYLVRGHDHSGQGRSIQPGQPLGYFGPSGFNTLCQDAQLIGQTLNRDYPECPLIVLGHSMGSMLLTQYLKQSTTPLQGAIMLGPIEVPHLLQQVLPIIQQLAQTAPQQPGILWQQLSLDFYNRRFPKGNPFAWVSHNLKNAAAFSQDPLCNYPFTNNGFATLLEIAAASRQTDWYEALITTPLLVLSGQDDPAGAYGRRAQSLKKAFEHRQLSQTTVHVLPNLSHELLNETTHRRVYFEILTWLDAILENHLVPNTQTAR